MIKNKFFLKGKGTTGSLGFDSKGITTSDLREKGMGLADIKSCIDTNAKQSGGHDDIDKNQFTKPVTININSKRVECMAKVNCVDIVNPDPRVKREINFYEMVEKKSNTEINFRNLKKFMPKYYGPIKNEKGENVGFLIEKTTKDNSNVFDVKLGKEIGSKQVEKYWDEKTDFERYWKATKIGFSEMSHNTSKGWSMQKSEAKDTLKTLIRILPPDSKDKLIKDLQELKYLIDICGRSNIGSSVLIEITNYGEAKVTWIDFANDVEAAVEKDMAKNQPNAEHDDTLIRYKNNLKEGLNSLIGYINNKYEKASKEKEKTNNIIDSYLKKKQNIINPTYTKTTHLEKAKEILLEKYREKQKSDNEEININLIKARKKDDPSQIEKAPDRDD